MERNYGIDWLRIGAFALLIFYHIGMFFVTWDWHVKTAAPQAWVEMPMLATNAWRLALLFLISGVASRFLLDKLARPGGFARERSWRLLVPLVFAMAVIVPPQPWAELQAKAGYAGGYWQFWANDYFEFGNSRGIDLPTWNHLWFVAYLWVYTMLLAFGRAVLPAGVRAALQAGFDRLFSGAALLWLPLLYLWLTRALLLPIFDETHGLIDDWYNHAIYLPLFLFGVAMAKSEGVWRAAERWWKVAALAAIAGYACRIAYYLAYPDDASPGEPWEALYLVIRQAHMWGAILALLALARLKLNRDSAVRRYLTQAIFPFYIAHQTVIVVVGHWLNGYDIGPAAEFAIILPATVLGCFATYELARRVPGLGPLLGLKASPRLQIREVVT